MKWDTHFNRFPRKDREEITFIEFQLELGQFAGFEKRRFKQIRELGMANCYFFKLESSEIGIGFGIIETGKGPDTRCWRFGTNEEWEVVYSQKL